MKKLFTIDALRRQIAARADAAVDQGRHRPVSQKELPGLTNPGNFLMAARTGEGRAASACHSGIDDEVTWQYPAFLCPLGRSRLRSRSLPSRTSPRSSAISSPSTICRSNIYHPRVLRAARRVRLRQVHALAHAGGLRAADLRRDHARRHRALPAFRPTAAGQHDVPVLCAVSAHDGREQHRLRPQAGRHAEGRDRRARRRRC